MTSLQTRFTRMTIAVLIVFSLLFALLLGRAFHRAFILSEENRLKGIVYAFVSIMDVDQNGKVQIDDVALSNSMGSENQQTIFVLDENRRLIWKTGVQALNLGSADLPAVGEWEFQHNKKNRSSILYFGLSWENEKNKLDTFYTVGVVDSGKFYTEQTTIFRKTLWTWLTLGCLGLLLLQLMMLRWGFQPLQQVAGEVQRIEKGQQHKFENAYPSELSSLTTNINSLLRHERAQQLRYQQALDNLAHALKTPLTAIKNLTMQQSVTGELQNDLNEQVTRMRDMMDYQLGKAKAVGKNPFAKSILIHEIVEKIVRSIQKVYVQKNIQIHFDGSSQASINMDEGDLFEVLGNIIENAAKYCKTKIHIDWNEQTISIDDDGPGFGDKIQSIVQRGVRHDQRTEGSGIGLSVAYEIITAFGGSLELTSSPSLGGARVIVHFSI